VYVENPPSSMLFGFCQGSFQFFPFLLTFVVHRCAYCVRKAGELLYKKSYKFLTSGAWFASAVRLCQCEGGLHKALVKIGRQKVCKDGKRRRAFSGIAANLLESQAYPDDLGRAIIAAWEGAGPLPPPSDFPAPRTLELSPRNRTSRRPAVSMAASAPPEVDAEVDASTVTEDPWSDADQAATPMSVADPVPPLPLSDSEKNDPWGGMCFDGASIQTEDPWDQADITGKAAPGSGRRKWPTPRGRGNGWPSSSSASEDSSGSEDPWE
jgi:hypothetical protein